MGTIASPTPRGLLRFLLRIPIVLYRLRLGWLLGKRFLLLTHMGRKSGMEHGTVLEVLRHDPVTDRFIIASGWGEKAQWFQNVVENADVRYTVGTHERTGRVIRVSPEEAEHELREYGLRHPRALRSLAKLMVGGEFEGTNEQYRTLSKKVPVLEIRANHSGNGADG